MSHSGLYFSNLDFYTFTIAIQQINEITPIDNYSVLYFAYESQAFDILGHTLKNILQQFCLNLIYKKKLQCCKKIQVGTTL